MSLPPGSSWRHLLSTTRWPGAVTQEEGLECPSKFVPEGGETDWCGKSPAALKILSGPVTDVNDHPDHAWWMVRIG